MNDDLRLLGLLVDPKEPGTPIAPLSEEIHIAADQLAAELMSGTLGMLLTESDRARLVALPLAMVRWADRAEALEEAARPRSRRERRRWWWPRLTWRFA